MAVTSSSPAPARSTATTASRADNGGARAEAIDDMVDQCCDLCVTMINAWRVMLKSSLSWFGPYYSAIDEATRATRDAMGGRSS